MPSRVAATDRLIGLLTAVARMGVIGVVCAAPWWFGGVEPDVQYLLYAGLLTSLAAWLVATGLQAFTIGPTATPLPSVLAVMMAALLLGSFQLWQVNDQLRTPRTAPDPAHAGPISPVPSARTLLPAGFAAESICPSATRLELARLVMAIIALYLGAVLFTQSESQVWLWTCLAVNGAALAFFGIAQQLSWNGKLFWTVPLQLGGQPFASYVNRNNAAGYLNLCLAAAWGLVIWWQVGARSDIAGRFGGKIWPMEPCRQSAAAARIRRSGNPTPHWDGRQLGVFAMLALIATGIVCSLSRGGVLAMVVATTAFCGLMARSWSGLRIATLLVGIGLLSVALLFWTGLTDRIGSRWEGVNSETISTDARLANWSDALRALRDFPITGTGFGTYRYAYLPYQTRPMTVVFHNADNQFVEGLLEGGMVGLGLILLSIGLSLWACLALARDVPVDPAAAVGLFAVISQCVSAFFDFGLSLSANMLTFALLVGAVTGRAAALYEIGSTSRWLVLPVLRPPWLTRVVGAMLLAHGVLCLGHVSVAADSRMVRRDLPRLTAAASLSESSVGEAISQLQSVVSRQPDDAEAHRALAELWTYRYRLRAIEDLAAQTTEGDPEPDWNLTDPSVLYLRIQALISADDNEAVAELGDLPQVRDNLLPAWWHLSAAQAACPLMPELDLKLAMLSFLGNPLEPAGEAHLRRAVQVAPGDSDLLVQCGTLAQAAGLAEFSYACWRRSLELVPDRLPQIRQLWSQEVTLEQEMEWILPDSPELLLTLARASYSGDEDRAARHTLALKAQRLLESQSGSKTEPKRLHALARCSVLLDEPDAAADSYRQSLVLEPLNVERRLELVGLLHQQHNYQEALDQAELCQAMAPQQAAIRKQVSELRLLTVRQATGRPKVVPPTRKP